MLRIAICDDNEIEMNIISEMLNQYLKKRKIKGNVKYYSDIMSILTEPLNFDIYLLDIVFPGDMNGIKLGKLIKAVDPRADIVYISCDKEYAFEAYKVRAVNYLLKPIGREELYSLLDELYIHAQQNRYILKTPEGSRKIILDDLIYVNIGRRSLLYHMRDGTVLEGLNIRTNFEIEVSSIIKVDGFLFLRPSLLVNLSEIEMISKEEVTFSNGEKIKVSKPQLKELKKAWETE